MKKMKNATRLNFIATFCVNESNLDLSAGTENVNRLKLGNAKMRLNE